MIKQDLIMNTPNSIFICLLILFTCLSCNKDNANEINKEQRVFFEKNANLNILTPDNEVIRTVTMTQAIIQALRTMNLDSSCNTQHLNYNALTQKDLAYTDSVSQILFPNVLGVACICPTGNGYCNWSNEMFNQFIVDTNLWNLQSIEVYLPNDEFLTEAIITEQVNHYALATMENKEVINALPSGAELRVNFTWLDSNNELQCIDLLNIIT